MEIKYDQFSRVLPFQECLIAKRQRQDIWGRWDTNNNGFLSLDQIEEGFLDLFNLERSENITTILKQSAAQMKKRFNVDGKFGPNYMEKREFRGFLEYFHRHFKSLILYQLISKNNQLQANKLIQLASDLIDKKLSQQQKDGARVLMRETKITFKSLQTWLSGLNYYSIGEVSI